MTPPASALPDKELIAAGYHLTRLELLRRPRSFRELAPDVIRALDVDPAVALPFIEHWYNFAAEELGEPKGTDRPFDVQAAFAEWSNGALEVLANQRAQQKEGEVFESVIRSGLTSFALVAFERIATEIKGVLAGQRACGIFGGEDYQTQWHEYAYHFQNGPPELDSTFDQLVGPLIAYAVEQIPPSEAVLLTLARQLEADGLEDWAEGVMDCEEIGTGVLDALRSLAGAVWFD